VAADPAVPVTLNGSIGFVSNALRIVQDSAVVAATPRPATAEHWNGANCPPYPKTARGSATSGLPSLHLGFLVDLRFNRRWLALASGWIPCSISRSISSTIGISSGSGIIWTSYPTFFFDLKKSTSRLKSC
jgi:hypothetical protein